MGADETQADDGVREQDCDDHEGQDEEDVPPGWDRGAGLREHEGEIWEGGC